MTSRSFIASWQFAAGVLTTLLMRSRWCSWEQHLSRYRIIMWPTQRRRISKLEKPSPSCFVASALHVCFGWILLKKSAFRQIAASPRRDVEESSTSVWIRLVQATGTVQS